MIQLLDTGLPKSCSICSKVIHIEKVWHIATILLIHEIVFHLRVEFPPKECLTWDTVKGECMSDWNFQNIMVIETLQFCSYIRAIMRRVSILRHLIPVDTVHQIVGKLIGEFTIVRDLCEQPSKNSRDFRKFTSSNQTCI